MAYKRGRRMVMSGRELSRPTRIPQVLWMIRTGLVLLKLKKFFVEELPGSVNIDTLGILISTESRGERTLT